MDPSEPRDKPDREGILLIAIFGTVALLFLYVILKAWIADGVRPSILLGAIFGPPGLLVICWLIVTLRKTQGPR